MICGTSGQKISYDTEIACGEVDLPTWVSLSVTSYDMTYKALIGSADGRAPYNFKLPSQCAIQTHAAECRCMYIYSRVVHICRCIIHA